MEKKTTHFGYQTIDEYEKNARVGAVFDSVSGKYDLMNDVMSLGIHRFWKDWFVWQCDVLAGETVLDLASGTGDIARRLGKKMSRGGTMTGQLIVSDINQSMLERGKMHLIEAGFLQNVAFVLADAEHLPFADESVDLITMAFGLRNVTHQQQALNEMARVLKPNGRVFILEFSHMRSRLLRKTYDWYSFNVLPRLGGMIVGDRESYQYLAESIRMMPTQEELKNMFAAAGFVSCEYQNLMNGMVAIHQGFKPY